MVNKHYPIKVFIGSSPSEWLPAKVLEYSIRKNTSSPVEVTRLYETNIEIPLPKHKQSRPRTPFSFQRFLIPYLCNFSGRAIYLDADMLVFSDILHLWQTDMSGNDIISVAQQNPATQPQFSVMLMDTEHLHWDIKQIVAGLDRHDFTYDDLMYGFCIAKSTSASIDINWNCLETYTKDTKLLHYTNMHLQPWVSLKNPLRNLWIAELRSALNTGFISMSDIAREIERGNVRPSLHHELRLNKEGKSLSDIREFELLDGNFRAPFHSLTPSLFHRILRKVKNSLTGNGR